MTVPTYTDWYTDYHEDVEAALVDAFEAAAVVVDPYMPQVEAHRLAVKFAEERAGELLTVGGRHSLSEYTLERVRSLVATAIANGDSLKALQKSLRDDIVFSKDRAALTARTETAIAHGQGSKQAAQLSGRDGKRWETQGVACSLCLGNEGDGDIGIDEVFSSGHDTIPAHPKCECNVRHFHRR
ncbi:MAG TPA: phage minor head protein [Anaerolineae bacterium]|nr:phage minor head protein [Anaerolineae bacterium]HUW95998.1 phage minor head protein [Anaerolineae bacterium]